MAKEALKTELLLKKAEKFSLSEVKTMLDDCLRKTLNDGLEYKESNRHINTKLMLGYPAAMIAGAVAFYTWVNPFEETKHLTILGVILYFIFNSALMFYIWFVEGSTVYVGSKGNSRIELKSTLKNYDPIYKLEMILMSGGGDTKNQVKKESKLERNISAWIDVDGHLAADQFISDIYKFIGNSK